MAEKECIESNSQLMAEWNWDKNNELGLLPSEIVLGSGKKVWWKCASGHEWQASVVNRSQHNTGCPYCSGRKAIPGTNDLATLYPDIAAEWNTEKNGDLSPTMVSPGSGKKVWWKCKKGHEWQTTVAHRTLDKNECPYCTGKSVLTGYNDLTTTNLSLASEWHPTKNGNLLPTMISSGSSQKVWWKCKKGHEWQTSIANRTNGRNCPYCSGKEVLLGFNDLLTVNPDISAEWHPTKNGDLLPSMVTLHSGKKIWWKCKEGHEWQASVTNRVNGRGCPYCSGKKVLVGYNDLATKNPSLASEWHPTKNGNLLPMMVSAGSHKKVWWICRKGHEWEAVVNSRTVQNTGCPVCFSEQQTSFPEQAILFYCNQVTKAESRNTDFGKEIDIFLPEFKTGIEYNGIFWHKNKNDKDKRKVEFFADKNIRVITIAESEQNTVSGDTIEYIYSSSNKDSLNWAIEQLLNLMNLNKVSVDVINDAAEIYNQYINIEKKSSLANKFPEIAKQWNFEKNLSLTPEMVSPYSNKKIWWECQYGHEWQAVVSSRVAGNGCPYCSGQKALIGYNDLATLYPEIASEWHPTKNGDLLPSSVLASSRLKAWWICSICNNEYQSAIYHRTQGSSCPYCSGKRISSGINDFASLNPSLAAEWHPTKNGDLLPSMVTLHSGKKVWWQCTLGHEWQSTVANRVSGRGCPYCSGKKVLAGYNDLATKDPMLASEWHPAKNGNLLPTMVSAGSHKKVWWLCKNGHEWQAVICNRKNENGCPICAKYCKKD